MSADVGWARASDTAHRRGAMTNVGGSDEQMFCGAAEAPFYVDLGALFDLAGWPAAAPARV